MTAGEPTPAGHTALRPLQMAELGEVAGKTLLHLQCHFGLDTLSLARLGAVATGVDFSDQAIALDRKLVEAHLSKAAAARALGKMDIVQEVCRELATLEPEDFRRAS